MILQSVFPIPVGFFKLGRKLTELEESFILGQKLRPNVSNKTSEDFYLLNREELKDLCTFANNCINEYFYEIYKPSGNVVPYMTQSWANYTNQNESHHLHRHSNSFCSGVFYVKADKELDKIHFARQSYDPVEIMTNDWNTYNSTTWWYSVGEGDLVIFPSKLFHKVEAVDTDRTRVSIAFNTFVRGTVGIDVNLTELILP